MFFQPDSLEEALEIRARLGAEAVPIAGGTDVVTALNRQTGGPKHFIDLTHIAGFSDVGHEEGVKGSRDQWDSAEDSSLATKSGEPGSDGRWVLAGGATFSGIVEGLGGGGLTALVEAARSIGGPAIRNRGTIGGNLGTASPAGDACVALLAVDAEVELSHATRGRRVIPIGEYFTGFRQTALLADELITAVRVPDAWRTAWYKIGKRGATNISVACCAIGLSPAESPRPWPGGGRAVRIAFGSVAPTVMRARRAEAIIEAGGLNEETIEAATAAAMEEVRPIDDHRASAAYRRGMCGVLVRRLLHDLKRRNVETSKRRNEETSKSQKVKKSKQSGRSAKRQAGAGDVALGDAPPGQGRGLSNESACGEERWRRLRCRVNGGAVEVDVEQDETLLDVLRDRLGLTGTKGACLEGECGSCTVIVEGRAVNACLVLAAQVEGRTIETIEGLAEGDRLHALQEAFLETGAAQCGYCTPGLVMAAKALFDANARPTEEEMLAAMEGNICRCTGYAAIRAAMKRVASG
jgi:xanthine dehydrogenase iron-sulfur cluster and FAD-binding subunit A